MTVTFRTISIIYPLSFDYNTKIIHGKTGFMRVCREA